MSYGEGIWVFFFNKRGKYRWRGVYYFQALDNQESLLREIDDAFYGKYTGLDIYDNQFSIANARTFTITVTWRSFRQIGEMRGGRYQDEARRHASGLALALEMYVI
jgi:hypothetical protein